MSTSISEKTIEDILAADKAILAEILSLSASDLSLIIRQKQLKSGKLDLLYLHKTELLLIELKVVAFYRGILKQINDYCTDLMELQSQNRIINADIRKILLVTNARPADIDLCRREQIELIVYKPQDILAKFFENFKQMTYFLRIESADYGVTWLRLLKPTLALLSNGNSIEQICQSLNKSSNTIRNRLSVAMRLQLVSKFKHKYFLTDLGNALLSKSNSEGEDEFNQEQIDLLADFIMENPFFSTVTFTIFSIIESAFVLSKSIYPVPFERLRDYFVELVGKASTWKKAKARDTATYIFSNYACELQFLSKVNNYFYLTPRGIRAVLLLQLNRSLKLIESQG
ncbi:hypothetical protein GX441_06180 [bacterium]|nr:hypothetical protein [bacterium]